MEEEGRETGKEGEDASFSLIIDKGKGLDSNGLMGGDCTVIDAREGSEGCIPVPGGQGEDGAVEYSCVEFVGLLFNHCVTFFLVGLSGGDDDVGEAPVEEEGEEGENACC